MNTVNASELEEGNEIVVSRARNDVGIVEDVVTAWSMIGNQTRTTITLTDGRTFTVPNEHPVEVLS